MRTVIYGSEGTIITDNTSNHLSLFRSNAATPDAAFSVNQGMELKIPVSISSHNMIEEIRDFCTSILNDTPLSPDGKQGLFTVAVCDAIVRSSKEGNAVTVDYTV